MSRRLADLHPALRPLAVELIARCAEAGIPLYMVDTLRTEAEHKENLKKGTSWIKRSKHMFDRDWYHDTGEKRSRAFDVAPYSVYDAHGPNKINWDKEHPHWRVIGKIGEALGMEWGGRWPKEDMGHFQLPKGVG